MSPICVRPAGSPRTLDNRGVPLCSRSLLAVDEEKADSHTDDGACFENMYGGAETRPAWRSFRLALPRRSLLAVLSVGALAFAGGYVVVAMRSAKSATSVDMASVGGLNEKETDLPWYMDMELASPPPEHMGDNMDGSWGFSASGFGPDNLHVSEGVSMTVDEHTEAVEAPEGSEPMEPPGIGAPKPPPAARPSASQKFQKVRTTASPPQSSRLHTTAALPRLAMQTTAAPPPPAQPSSQKPARKPPPQAQGEKKADSPCSSHDAETLKGSGRQKFEKDMNGCSTPCWGESSCTADCMADHGYSASCSKCFGELSGCTRANCMWQCMGGNSPSCGRCADEHCKPVFEKCSGLSLAWRRSGKPDGPQ
mmetsp:Transcript_105445/g.303230  ORF Transcript_105445/g.303230 Transcript_105445/m.303230 type:complete len:366 (-) Transcript_105445:84-1181(-)